MIKFNINGGNTIEGNFVAVDPVSKLLVIGIIIIISFIYFLLFILFLFSLFNLLFK